MKVPIDPPINKNIVTINDEEKLPIERNEA